MKISKSIQKNLSSILFSLLLLIPIKNDSSAVLVTELADVIVELFIQIATVYSARYEDITKNIDIEKDPQFLFLQQSPNITLNINQIKLSKPDHPLVLHPKFIIPNPEIHLPEGVHASISVINSVKTKISQSEIGRLFDNYLLTGLKREKVVNAELNVIDLFLNKLATVVSKDSTKVVKQKAFDECMQLVDKLLDSEIKSELSKILDNVAFHCCDKTGTFNLEFDQEIVSKVIVDQIKAIENSKYIKNLLKERINISDQSIKKFFESRTGVFSADKAIEHLSQNAPDLKAALENKNISYEKGSLRYSTVRQNRANINFSTALELLRQNKIEDFKQFVKSAYGLDVDANLSALKPPQHFRVLLKNYKRQVFDKYGFKKKYENNPVWKAVPLEQKKEIARANKQDEVHKYLEMHEALKNNLKKELNISDQDAADPVVENFLYNTALIQSSNSNDFYKCIFKYASQSKEVANAVLTNNFLLKKFESSSFAKNFSFEVKTFDIVSESTFVAANKLLSLNNSPIDQKLLNKGLMCVKIAAASKDKSVSACYNALANAYLDALNNPNAINIENLKTLNPGINPIKDEEAAIEFLKTSNDTEYLQNGLLKRYQNHPFAETFYITEDFFDYKKIEAAGHLNDCYGLLDAHPKEWQELYKAAKHIIYASDCKDAAEFKKNIYIARGLFFAVLNDPDFQFMRNQDTSNPQVATQLYLQLEALLEPDIKPEIDPNDLIYEHLDKNKRIHIFEDDQGLKHGFIGGPNDRPPEEWWKKIVDLVKRKIEDGTIKEEGKVWKVAEPQNVNPEFGDLTVEGFMHEGKVKIGTAYLEDPKLVKKIN